MGEMIPLRQMPAPTTTTSIPQPAELDRRLKAALPAAVTRALEPIYTEESGGRVGYRLIGAIADDDLVAARALVDRATAPADEATIKIELARLRASTKSRPETQATATMILQVVGEQAAQFPRDVMIAAFRAWAEREVFFPAVAEIRAEMEWRARYRRHLAGALDQREAPKPAEPARPPNTPEALAYVDECVRRMKAILAGPE